MNAALVMIARFAVAMALLVAAVNGAIHIFALFDNPLWALAFAPAGFVMGWLAGRIIHGPAED